MKEIFEKLDWLFEGAGWGGIEYEHKVINALELVQDAYPSLQLLPGKSKQTDKPIIEAEKASAGFSSQEPDIKLLLRKSPYNLECKMNSEAPMGSLTFNYIKGQFEITEKSKDKVDPKAVPLILDALKEIEPAFLGWMEFVKNDPVQVANRKNGITSTTVTKKTWTEAVKAGKLIPVNKRIPYNADFVTRLYNKKDVFYIQIGGSGLFYLGSNPAKLPEPGVPKFDGDILIECRLGPSGSRIQASTGLRTVGSTFRVNARLVARRGMKKSSYTLDDPNSIVSLLKAIGDINKDTEVVSVSKDKEAVKEPNDKRNI